MATSVVHRISIIDADDYDTAIAALIASPPAFGENFAHADLASAGFFTIGARAAGDDADIDSDAIKIKAIHEGVTVRPAGSLAAQRYITRHAGIDTVMFKAYDVVQDVFNLDSNVAVDGQYSHRTATQTNRAMLIEWDGIRVDCYPNIVLFVEEEDGGYGPGDKAVNVYSFKAQILATDDVPSGQIKYHYIGAGS